MEEHHKELEGKIKLAMVSKIKRLYLLIFVYLTMKPCSLIFHYPESKENGSVRAATAPLMSFNIDH